MSDVTIVIKAQNQAQAAMQAVRSDLEQIGRTAGGLKQQLANAATEMRNVGMGLTAGVTLPIVGIAATAINSAAQFEQSLNVMQQVSGATETQMASMQEQALQLGAETAFSAGEAAAGMLELAKAGLSTDQVMAAIGGTMDLAAAGNLDLAQAAEIAANAVNTFGLDATETVDVANMLAAAANASSVEVSDLAQGMNMAGAVFASSGQNIDDLTTAMALMGNAGIKGSDAGTSLKTMLMRLSAPTGEAADLMAQLGVSMYNLDGSTRALPDVLADLQAAMYGANAVSVTSSNLTAEQSERMDYLKSTIEKTQRQLADYQSGIAGVAQSENDKVVAVDRLNRVLQAAQAEYTGLAAVGGTTTTVMREMTDESRAAALTTIFGADAIRAVNVLMAEGEEGWAAMAEAVGAQGAATAVANARMSGMAGAIEYIKGSLDSFLIGSALPFLDTMGGIVRQAADAITWFGALDPAVKNAALAFTAVLAAAGPVLLALSGIATAIGFLLSPIGIVVVGLAALAAAWTMNFGGIQEITAQAFAIIQPYLQAAYDWMMAQIPGALTTLQTTWDATWAAISAAASAAWAIVQPYLQSAYDWLQTEGPAALATLQASWDATWAAISAATSATWAVIGPYLLSALAWLQTNAPAALTVLQAAWDATWAALQTAVDTTWAVIGPYLQSALTWLQTDGPAALTAFQASWDATWAALQTATDTAWVAIQAALDTALAWFQTDAPGALTTLQTTWDATWNGLQETASAVWAQLEALFGPAMTRLQEAFTKAQTDVSALGPKFTELMTAVQNMWTTVQPVLQAFAMFVAGTIAVVSVLGVNLLAQAFNSLSTVVGAVFDQVTLTINTFSTLIEETVTLIKAILEGDWATAWASAQSIVETFKTYFEETFENLKTLAKTIFDAIYTAVNDTLTDLNVDGKAILDGIKTWWTDIWGSFSEKIKPVTDAIASVRTALEGFKGWLSSFSLPNPLAGLSNAAQGLAGQVSGAAGAAGATLGGAAGAVGDFFNGPSPGGQLGKSYWTGGPLWVGEAGRELLIPPRGSQIIPNRTAEKLAGATDRVAVTVQQMIVRDDKDIYALAYQVADILARG